MAAPVVVDIVTYFYPIGNTSAVHLTRNLPRNQSAEILLLGCGDVRNIVFTAYMDQGSDRNLDFTCCDIQPDTIARNILLLTLASDDTDGIHDSSMWNIYYHMYLDTESMRLLNDHATKLHKLATSMQSWSDSKYGQQFRFCDGETLAEVRDIWHTYCVTSSQAKEWEHHLQRSTAAIQRAMSTRGFRMEGGKFALSGIRSAAPAGTCAIQDAPQLGQHYWEHGSTEREGQSSRRTAENINPAFVTDASILHYGTDPLLGFHLAVAYAPLTAESPLRSRIAENSSRFKLVEAARHQFRSWMTSFRQYPRKKLTMRFSASDAIAFSYALQQKRITESNKPAVYRDPYHLKPLILDGEDYLKSGSAPVMFTVIDTSNLIDHVGALNLLVAATPLLNSAPSSSLYTQSLVKSQETETAYINTLLCGHYPTISTLLGLLPVEYWTNISPTSMMDDLLVSSFSSAGQGQMHIRLTWKRSFPRQESQSPATPARLRFDDIGLARILHDVYLKMFRNEDLQQLFSNMDIHTVTNNSLLRYNRRSFALFLRFARTRVICDWNKVMDCLHEFIGTDLTLLMNLNYIQELYTYLHVYDVFSMDAFTPAFSRSNTSPSAVGLRSWTNIPPVLYVTMVVPRKALGVITSITSTKIGSPILHCIVQSSPGSTSGTWQNIFSAVQSSFGIMSTTGDKFSGTFRIHVAEDKFRWKGSSPLLVTFMAPTWMILLEPETATIAFGIQSTPASSAVFTASLGVDMDVYKTKLANEQNVFFTQFPPNQTEYAALCAFPNDHSNSPASSNAVARALVTASVESHTGKIASIVGRLEGFPEQVNASLQSGCKVDTLQTSPFAFMETLGPKPWRITLELPAPVCASKNKTRIARKSSYIEVEAPLADATSWKSFPSFMYPTFLWFGTPTAWNIPYLNLDRLPAIDTNKQKELQWLHTHTSGMFNMKERLLLQRYKPGAADSVKDVRLRFKESLFSMFMTFTGLQNQQQTTLFALNNPTAGGVHVLVFVSGLKLDIANHTVVLDTAILVLTDDVMSRIGSFLATLLKSNVCYLKVDSEEMGLWKQILPAMVERCRTWEHRDECEYLTESKLPLSVQHGQAVVCSCGNGRFPPRFIPDAPQWSTVSEKFVRAALSPCFQTPFSEKLFDFSVVEDKIGAMQGCMVCGKSRTKSGEALLSCGKCHQVKYCSVDCQRLDWKKHKTHCQSRFRT